MPRTEVFERRT